MKERSIRVTEATKKRLEEIAAQTDGRGETGSVAALVRGAVYSIAKWPYPEQPVEPPTLVQLKVAITDDLWEAATAIAKVHGVTLAEAVRLHLEEFVQEEAAPKYKEGDEVRVLEGLYTGDRGKVLRTESNSLGQKSAYVELTGSRLARWFWFESLEAWDETEPAPLNIDDEVLILGGQYQGATGWVRQIEQAHDAPRVFVQIGGPRGPGFWHAPSDLKLTKRAVR